MALLRAQAAALERTNAGVQVLLVGPNANTNAAVLLKLAPHLQPVGS